MLKQHLRSPPGHDRSGASTDDPQQALPLVVIDLTDTHTLSRPSTVVRRAARPATRRHVTSQQRGLI
ncbi:hypothetical protein [Streptomyces sp. NPDC001380]|uniref:hypothetical protein n=1 Tax=Streptomyces sp. NPDC001380 TaxID=3364566 RepID=UPI00367E5E13